MWSNFLEKHTITFVKRSNLDHFYRLKIVLFHTHCFEIEENHFRHHPGSFGRELRLYWRLHNAFGAGVGSLGELTDRIHAYEIAFHGPVEHVFVVRLANLAFLFA
jgi:hypothetical protein